MIKAKMIRKEDLEQRLEDLGWTLYKLAKQFSEMRAVDGEVSPATRYHSAIGKAMENPAKSKLETIEGIVQALNGELTIVWELGRVVTIRLDDEQMAALEERAKTDGTTVSKVAEQLLQLALSGALVQKPKKVTELFIGEEAKIYRSFHPLIVSAYSAVHQWLAERPEAEGYKELEYSKDLWRSLEQTDLKSTAFQYYAIFPRYYFEAAHVIENVIHSTRLLNGIKYNPRICIVDVGCAIGAASSAFIERILTLQKDENISNPIEIYCLGIDPSIYGITLYSKLMQEIKQNVSYLNIHLEFQPICERVPKAIITAMRYLQKKQQQWDKPLSNLFLMQLDVASSLSQDEILKREQYEKLKELGLEPDFILETGEEFWQEEALGYKHLLEELPVEHLHLMTLGTKNLEKHLQKISKINNLRDGIQEISQAIKRVISNTHRIAIVLEGEQKVDFENPIDSYWKEQHEHHYSSTFYASFHTINSSEQKEDKYWNDLISIENMELAWVKARNNLLNRESCYDEIEIRLFEKNLANNLRFMQQQLIAYCDSVIPENELISYNFIKSLSATRPKQLLRLEEEILSAAIIQKLGQEFDCEFYSYRPQKESWENPTEDLYENWWELYKSFRDAVRETAKNYPDGAVIRTDIKSYYTTIIQKQLLEITKEELSINSERLIWLIKKIILKNLTGHQPGVGLSQGTITSGFYANLYLSSVDSRFKKDKKLRLKYYRYVDDIIIILPSKLYIKEAESILEEELRKIGLKINEDKTDHYNNISDFLEIIMDDYDLDKLSKEFNYILSNLWIMNPAYRIQFEFAHKSETENLWWHLIHLYQQCLNSINIYVMENHLSRKVYQYLFQPNRSKKQHLNLPPFPKRDNFSVISNWAKLFHELEVMWLEEKDSLKIKIVDLFNQSVQEFRQVVEHLKNNGACITEQEKRELIVNRRRLETRIRFAVNKLSILGFNEVRKEIVSLICGDLFVIRDLRDVVVSLARQGYTDAIKQLREYYQSSEHESEYIRAVILEALRFLPSLDAQDWHLIFESSTEGKFDIERLKATETWLYLSDDSKHFVQSKHIEAVVKALNSAPPPFNRLKKNYILILGMHDPDAISNILPLEDNDDYLIRDALKLALEGKVSELFKENEPAIVRDYYNVKKAAAGEDKPRYSL